MMAQIPAEAAKPVEPYFKLDQHSSLVGRTKEVRRRSKVEIAMDILRAMCKEELPTHIMYRANLSWSILAKWLEFLERQGLITISSAGKANSYHHKLYHLTTSGFQLVEQWDALLRSFEVS